MRILINVPKLSNPGGVSVLYNVLKIQDRYDNVKLFQIHSKLPSFLGFIKKYIEFFSLVKLFDIIQLNPSLNKKSFFRDSIYAYIAKLAKKKLVVYWHGWENDYEEAIFKSKFLKWIFKKTFAKADLSIVLGQVFSDKLKNLGFQNRIIIETNAVESRFLSFPLKKRVINQDDEIKLLFIARLQKEKGVYEAIETLKLLNKEQKNKYKLIIAGSGNEEEKIAALANNDDSIDFLGYIRDEDKHKALLNSDILFFPTYYPEGLPLTILEGIMYGLPVISRPVGGISDIIIHERNGFIIESKDAKDFANVIKRLSSDNNLYSKISENNIEKSSMFMPSSVCERLMGYYNSIV
ncbi:glycosyltransferase family 4 protein [Zunongwangia endophytica]|uniref:Glycosyltransferase family 4 protein n=1 Tax=Zunongwangia endophytica TaxID=1808945 RepID=A0ABV8HBT5_9FLAO|nr:glycosyltransferase family 4 protein [Zunongwangia endophytica]MDN3596246.1 glycosyltransferase family 4 protein [Zunongwangia endophytica]